MLYENVHTIDLITNFREDDYCIAEIHFKKKSNDYFDDDHHYGTWGICLI